MSIDRSIPFLINLSNEFSQCKEVCSFVRSKCVVSTHTPLLLICSTFTQSRSMHLLELAKKSLNFKERSSSFNYNSRKTSSKTNFAISKSQDQLLIPSIARFTWKASQNTITCTQILNPSQLTSENRWANSDMMSKVSKYNHTFHLLSTLHVLMYPSPPLLPK